MKKDQKQTIRELNDEQLVKKLEELSQKLFDLKMKLNTGNLKNVREIKVVKNEIAIIKTIQSERKTTQ